VTASAILWLEKWLGLGLGCHIRIIPMATMTIISISIDLHLCNNCSRLSTTQRLPCSLQFLPNVNNFFQFFLLSLTVFNCNLVNVEWQLVVEREISGGGCLSAPSQDWVLQRDRATLRRHSQRGSTPSSSRAGRSNINRKLSGLVA